MNESAPSQAMKLVVVGVSGRMGRTLVQAVEAMEGVTLTGAIARPGSPDCGRDAGEIAGTGPLGVKIGDDAASAISNADGVLDFTAPEASADFAKMAADAGIVHVIGTTGWQGEHDAAIEAASERARIVRSGNMSLGVNLLSVLVRQAARALDAADWDVEVFEMHHRHKVDAPSGTALLLGEAAAEGRGVRLDDAAIRGRDGHTGAREPGAIGFASLRGGSVTGEHSVFLAGEGERIALTHQATDRTIFARGAVKAALWARTRPPGLYSMLDVLGLSA